MVISLRLFGHALRGQAVFLSTDNTGVLHAGLQLRASSPGMVKVAAELACALRQFDIEMSQGSHLRSAANYFADALSRLSQGAAVPARLVPVLRLTAGPRDAWWAKSQTICGQGKSVWTEGKLGRPGCQ